MKTTDERMRDVLARAHAREAASRRRRQRSVAIGGGVLSVVILVAVGVGIASMAGPTASPSASATLGLMGSVFADSSALGYVATGLLGLVLGIVVTALAYRAGGTPESPKASETKLHEGKSTGNGMSTP